MARKQAAHHSKQFAVFVMGLLVALLVLHTFFSRHVDVDNTTVLLLIVLVLVPYLPWITRIKFGDFEAEIGREEVRQIEKNLDASETQPTKSPLADEEIESARALSRSDPTVAFFKIRLAIERRLKWLMEIYDPDTPSRRLSASAMVGDLAEKNVIDGQLAAALRDVIGIANRAVHGETIQNDSVDNMMDLSIRAIHSLDGLVIDRALNSMKAKIITQELVDARRNAQYEVRTIVPNVKNPEERTYSMNQAELDAFLEGYDEYAEFIVSIKEVKK